MPTVQVPANYVRGIGLDDLSQPDATRFPMVLSLHDPRCRRSELAGNKGAMLARLISAGYPVPPGLCLTPIAATATASAWSHELSLAITDLDSPWVARSSSTVEDSSGHAFPGIFTTVLGIHDFSALTAAIQTVHASASSDTVLRYAAHHGIDISTLHMAVVVQTLLPATVSGVAFGRHPVSGESMVLIEANHGLGESVVDGSVTPDRIAVMPNGNVRFLHIGSKRHKVVCTATGVARVPTTPAEGKASVLHAGLAMSIAHLVRQLEADLGSPQDVEWCAVDAELFLLQSRPITTL